MCVSTEHVFPIVNRAKTGMGLCGEALPKRPYRPIPASRRRASGMPNRRRRAGRCRSPSHGRQLLLGGPRVSGVRMAPPEHRLHALRGREPPMVSKDGP